MGARGPNAAHNVPCTCPDPHPKGLCCSRVQRGLFVLFPKLPILSFWLAFFSAVLPCRFFHPPPQWIQFPRLASINNNRWLPSCSALCVFDRQSRCHDSFKEARVRHRGWGWGCTMRRQDEQTGFPSPRRPGHQAFLTGLWRQVVAKRTFLFRLQGRGERGGGGVWKYHPTGCIWAFWLQREWMSAPH